MPGGLGGERPRLATVCSVLRYTTGVVLFGFPLGLLDLGEVGKHQREQWDDVRAEAYVVVLHERFERVHIGREIGIWVVFVRQWNPLHRVLIY
jgi:hypothetical protein